MSRTTDVIKKIKAGLECCAADECHGNHVGCPYIDTHICVMLMAGDALAYINDLEQRISLNTLRDAIYEDAVKHGLWEGYSCPTDYVYRLKDEVCELDDAAMELEDNMYDSCDRFSEELADVIIMSLSVAGKMGIDIDAAVRRKMEINRGRPWKHGKEDKQC